jgi:hypothetical protein
MDTDLSSLPDDALMSKKDVVALAIQYQEKIHYLEDRIRLLQNELFGRKREKNILNPTCSYQSLKINQIMYLNNSSMIPSS